MSARKKTPDILSHILGETPSSPKPPKEEPRKTASREISLLSRPEPHSAPGMDTVNTLIKEGQSELGSGAVDTSHFVSFKLEGQHYALPLEQVERALRMVALVPIPESQPWIVGMLNLHTRAIPVMDLRRRFGLEDKAVDPEDRLLLLRTPQETIALRVDEVCDVLEMPARQVEPAQESLGRSRPVQAVIRRDEELVMVLDVEKLERETV